MAAGLGFKEFTTGDVLTAADANGYLASQVVMVFDDAAARTTAITSPQEGMITYLKDTNAVEKYDGAAWVAVGGGASPLTTKGDLYTFSTVDARLGVGANGTVLTADSVETTGMKWVAPAATSFPAFSAYAASNQTVTSAVWTKVTFGSETFDTDGNFASSRFTPTVAGYYQLNTTIGVSGASANDSYIAFYKNGTVYQVLSATNALAYSQFNGSSLIYFNGSSDYVEVFVNKTSTGSPNIVGDANGDNSWFNGVGVRA